MHSPTLAAAAVVAVVCGDAFAQTAISPPAEAPREDSRLPRLFSRLDADKDGNISKSEFIEAQMARFKRLDVDGDGAVSKEEWGARRANANPERVQRAFERFDRNGDGKISAEEWASAGERVFVRADRDRDGFLSENEVTSVGRRRAAPNSP